MRAHTILTKVLSGLYQVRRKPSCPGPKVLCVGKDQVYHAQLGTEYAAYLIDQILEDLVGLGPYRIQVIKRS